MRSTSLLVLVAAAAVVVVVGDPRRGRGKTSRLAESLEKKTGRRGFHVDFNKAENNETASREGKFFPIFNIVQFKNLPCQSNAGVTGSGNQRNGTCYTATECQDRGGSSSGNCASGFGVCCIFTLTSTSSTSVTENCTYIQNPSFPGTDTAATGVAYSVSKCSNDVCFLRLDFETFTIQGIGSTTNNDEGVCLDTFTVTTSTGQNVPVICGPNTGHHIYIDIGANAGDSATLTFGFQGTTTARTWDIKVTQVECTNANAPPNTCLQYLTDLTGRVETFNYQGNENHLNNQDYNVCIRAAAGFCCVQWMVCADMATAADVWDLDETQATGNDDTCISVDHVRIPESSADCFANSRGVQNRYCGTNFNANGLGANVPICDCTPPFLLGIFTNAFIDQQAAANMANAIQSRGACLEYTQVACQN